MDSFYLPPNLIRACFWEMEKNDFLPLPIHHQEEGKDLIQDPQALWGGWRKRWRERSDLI
jgi:hypothetical protein